MKKAITITVENTEHGLQQAADEMIQALKDIMHIKETEPNLPKKWDDLTEDDKSDAAAGGFLCNIDAESAFIALSALYDLRKAYWKAAGGWKPDWENSDQEKWGIYFELEKLNINNFYDCRIFLAFPTKEQANHFLNYHKDSIEQAKELL